MVNILRIIIISSLLIFLYGYHSFGQQNYEITGRVVTYKSNKPIPYAHIQITETSIGTITNEQGFFRLLVPGKFANKTLKISSIGFETSFFKMPFKDITIRLKESTKFLENVVITPIDVARQLVEEAILKIDTNYPARTSQLEGFFRGVMKRGDSIAYITEGTYLIEKESYQNASKNGKVKLIKGRHVELFEINYFFYGAHFVPHYADFVHKRSSFINKAKLKHYNYEILDTIGDEGNQIARVVFKSKKKPAKGELFINLQDYAFVKIKYQYSGDEEENSVLEKIRGTKRLYRNYAVEYKKADSLWYISFVKYNSAMSFDNRTDTLHWTDIFTTTKIPDTIEPIKYEDQFQYRDITLTSMGTYDSSFWNNYNIILPDKKTELLFKKNDSSKIKNELTEREEIMSKQKQIVEQLSKFRFTMGLFVQSATIDNITVSYDYGSSNISETLTKVNFYYFGLSSDIDYYISSSFFIGLNTKANFTPNKYSSLALKLGYNKKVNSFSRPVSINFSINIGNYRYGHVVGKYNVDSNLEINSKTFDSGEVEVSLESRRWAVEPTFRLSVEMSHQLSLFAEAGWNVPFHTTDGLYFKEKGQPFWKTKKTFLKLPNSQINLSDGNSEINSIPLKTNLMMNIGILYQMKY